jgi:hypothetical protein
MTGTELRDVFQSPAFRRGLEEMSSCLASIAQERPIVCLLARCLWTQGYKFGKFELENKKVDLTLYPQRQRIEFKFNFGRCEKYLTKELAKHGADVEGIWKQVQAKRIPKGFSVIPRILEDVCGKRPDIFVWIICSRDLSKVTSADRKHICNGESEYKYNLAHQYASAGQRLTVADSFIEKLHDIRPFSLTAVDIATHGEWFPCTYHFRICEFEARAKTAS